MGRIPAQRTCELRSQVCRNRRRRNGFTPLTSHFAQNYTRERGFQEPRPTTSSQSLAVRGERVLAVGTTKEMGRLAGPSTRTIDLVVIDRDYLTIPADEIKEIKSVITMVGGRVVYDAAAPVTTTAAR